VHEQLLCRLGARKSADRTVEPLGKCSQQR
jgi:hypothetical protein